MDVPERGKSIPVWTFIYKFPVGKAGLTAWSFKS